MACLEDAWGSFAYRSAARSNLPRDYKKWVRALTSDFANRHKEIEGFKTSVREARKNGAVDVTLVGAAQDRRAQKDARRVLVKFVERLLSRNKEATYTIQENRKRDDVTLTVTFENA